MKINKKKLIVRIIELIIIVVTIIVTLMAIKYATEVRGYKAFGGEYLIPIISLLAIMVIEDIYQESEKKKKRKVNMGKLNNYEIAFELSSMGKRIRYINIKARNIEDAIAKLKSKHYDIDKTISIRKENDYGKR